MHYGEVLNMDKHTNEADIKPSEQYEALFHHATIGIITTDGNGNIVDVIKWQFGFSNAELTGIQELSHTQSAGCVRYICGLTYFSIVGEHNLEIPDR